MKQVSRSVTRQTAFGLIVAFSALCIAGTALARPNLIVINTDDHRFDELPHMPLVQQLLVREGATFNNGFVVDSSCCPSRASLLRGQVVHNHGVLTATSSYTGGYQAVRRLGLEYSNIATWLRDSGYKTALFGKYFNGYPLASQGTGTPVGWDEWYAFNGGPRYYDYKLNQNGTIVSYGKTSATYSTDVLRTLAVDFLKRHALNDAPFFLYIAPNAPHLPSTPPKRHEKSVVAEYVKTPAYNEADVSDKPLWIQARLQYSDSRFDAERKNRLRTLLAVDDMISTLVNTLAAQGKLSNTYIIYTADNGYALGEHRLQNKGTAYDESARVPFVVRGPGITPGIVFDQFALNIDIAPTLAEWAGVAPAGFVDGRSLAPLLSATAPPDVNPKERFILERLEETGGTVTVPVYTAVRSHDHLFVRYADGERELYDLRVDPLMLESRHGFESAAQILELENWLYSLNTCVGPTQCRPDTEAQPVLP